MKKNNKKGFTLVELLAVIAILAILLMLIIPNVLELFTEGKKDSFVNQGISLWKVASQAYISNVMDPDGEIGPYCSESGGTKLDYEGDDDFHYYVSFSNGKIDKFYIYDNTYYFTSDGEDNLTINSIDATEIPQGKSVTISCDSATMTQPA